MPSAWRGALRRGRLFLEHGYDRVSLWQIADDADVAVDTVFRHFSGKEALVDDDVEVGLLAGIDERPVGSSILDALERHVLGAPGVGGREQPEFAWSGELVCNTPALDAHWRGM